MTGHWIRLNRLFSDSSTAVVIGADSGGFGHVVAGRTNLPEFVESLEDADGIVLSAAMMSHCGGAFSDRGGPLAIVRLDWPSVLCSRWEFEDTASASVIEASEAVAEGADMCLATFALAPADAGGVAEAVGTFANAVSGKRQCGIPLIGQLQVPAAERLASDELDERLVSGCEILSELGADIICAGYSGGQFEAMVAAAGVPVLASPIAEPADGSDVLAMAERAADDGASGVFVGRAAMEAEDPAALVEGLQLVVREGQSARQAAVEVGLA